MSTLLLRLAAPLQSWGVASKFDTRDTAREPTKSGVIGLLAAALGFSRTDSDRLTELKNLNFGVRIDQPGTLLRDYHTARQEKGGSPFVTNRCYLADAVFLVGLEGDKDLLQKLAVALKNPFFPLYLGRRSCPPEGKLVLGIREQTLRQTLEEESWQAREWYQSKLHKNKSDSIMLTIVSDAHQNDQGSFLRRDLPITYDQRHRQYDFRMVIDTPYKIPNPLSQGNAELPTEHDALTGWEG